MSDGGILHSTATVCVRCSSRLLARLPHLRGRLEQGTAAVGDDFFYAGELATRRASDLGDAVRLQRRISAHVPHTYAPFFKAAFLDRVTGDERDAPQFQFRPLGLATGVRVRTTRMEGTA